MAGPQHLWLDATHVHVTEALRRDSAYFVKRSSLVFNPPNPALLPLRRRSTAAAYCLVPVLYYVPGDVSTAVPVTCPYCSAPAKVKGWSRYRRVVSLNRNYFVRTRRYYCTGQACGNNFMLWMPAALSKTPAHIQAMLPCEITHRLAVDKTLAHLCRQAIVDGIGLEPFSNQIYEQHALEYHRLQEASCPR